jgi:Glycosidases
MTGPVAPAGSQWWRNAVIYQVYPRSFADGNGDGIGDLAGIRRRLPHLVDLGVDAMWLTPWYVSPMADGGYDVADYRAIDPTLGDVAEAESLISEALASGIRTIIDIVPNHVSSEHRWFREAIAAGPGSPERSRFWFRDGRGAHGDLPPTEWVSEFGGGTWTRIMEPDGRPGQWYLHLFDPSQPDLNWTSPEVSEEFLDVLRFWFDRGVAGIRIDSAALIAKDPSLPVTAAGATPGPDHPYIDRDDLHAVYQSWRRLADSYGDDRLLVGEVWLEDAERFGLYLRPGEMDTAFNFDFMARPWEEGQLRASIDATLGVHRTVGAPATWVLSNHDVTRPVTRYGREDTSFSFPAKRFGIPTDTALGRRRARAAAVLVHALPGALYVYQGEELGLPEVEDLPLDRLTDPMYERSGRVSPGRDGCRIPLPWSGDRPPYGFTDEGVTTWLPQPEGWGELSVAHEEQDPSSVRALYRDLIHLRHREESLQGGDLRWVAAPPGVLAFTRGALVCAVNLGAPTPLPDGLDVLVSSEPLERGVLATDAALIGRPSEVDDPWKEGARA